jgi:Flp pilus assembly secretin CpaC
MAVSCWSNRVVVLMGAGVLLWACSAGPPGPRPGARQRLAEWSSEHSVEEGIDEQRMTPATQSAERATATTPWLRPGEPLWIVGGKSRILEFRSPVQRVSIGDPEVAGIVVIGPRTIMINAKHPPKREGQAESAAPMGQRMASISSQTFTPEPKVAETTLAVWQAGASQPDVHTLFVADFVSQQVMLEVTVAEINRTALEEHGIDFRKIGDRFVTAYFMGGGLLPLIGTTVPPTGGTLLPLTVGSMGPNYIFRLPQSDITAFIQLLQTENLASVLAQPKILALSGQNAVFQVGGEIPIRIVSGFAADVEFKPFGTLVNFLPRISEEGDIILTVTPEVSQPDFTNEVEGVPSFITRRASTSARLRNGETLVLGGLLLNTRVENVRGVPYLMNIPGVGYVFRDTRYSNQVTELMVIVTPHLVSPMAPGTELALPTDRGPFTYDDVKTQYSPSEVTRPRFPDVLIKPNPFER